MLKEYASETWGVVASVDGEYPIIVEVCLISNHCGGLFNMRLLWRFDQSLSNVAVCLISDYC